MSRADSEFADSDDSNQKSTAYDSIAAAISTDPWARETLPVPLVPEPPLTGVHTADEVAVRAMVVGRRIPYRAFDAERPLCRCARCIDIL
jgi:hypothetical protein